MFRAPVAYRVRRIPTASSDGSASELPANSIALITVGANCRR
jgi:hypothetical protein